MAPTTKNPNENESKEKSSPQSETKSRSKLRRECYQRAADKKARQHPILKETYTIEDFTTEPTLTRIMKDSIDIKSESEIEVKEEVENGGIDPKTKTYCLLCQEHGHVINDNCVVNATCFSCGVKGHVRKDCYCLLCQERGHVINDGCATCFSCGIKGHVRRNCPSLLDTSSEIPDSGQKLPLSLKTQEHNPELEIPDDQKMEIPPSLKTVNILPKNDNIPAFPMSDSNPSAKTSIYNTEYIEAKDEVENKTEERDRERRLYNRPGLPSKIEAPCKYFFSKGCKFGLTCRFKHDNERTKTEVENIRNQGRSRSRERRNVQQDDPAVASGLTDFTAEKALSVAKAGPIYATTVKCQGQDDLGRNQEGQPSNQTNNGQNRQDLLECQVCDKIFKSHRTLNNHMKNEHGHCERPIKI